VCILRRVLEPELEEEPRLLNDGLSGSDKSRFDHYEIVRRNDGALDELGRGAMGVTYRAFDIHLRCPVTLKVINEKYLSDESARRRFLREARAAASLRHPNVASVFYLGRSIQNYFYVMEFVEGETLEHLIKRSGRLEVKLALEIAREVAAGLAAIHKQKLIHRDIKPSNIMVKMEDGGAVTVKIIDLGLAKAINEPGSESAISRPGMFIGTPAFASPEQFAGVGVDIRSDLYSFGATLWAMLTGKAPFRGSCAEVMHQHLHAPLPLEQLDHLPYPAVSLVESLLSKDPAKRPHNPAELCSLISELRTTLDANPVNRPADPQQAKPIFRGGPRRNDGTQSRSAGWTAEAWDFRPFLIAKLKDFVGRQWLFKEIDEWRATGTESALLIIGEPGVGKSSLVAALAEANPDDQVLAYHFCRADTPATLDPAGFVRSLATILSDRLDGYAGMLEESASIKSLQGADIDPAGAFESAILGPLHRMHQPTRNRPYLLIDALDEALIFTRRPTIVDVLSRRLHLLPTWLRIIATTRNDPSVLRQLRSLRARILSTADPRNQEDLRQFIRRRLAEPTMREKTLASGKSLGTIEQDLLRSSAGNFLFVTTALDAVESSQVGLDQIEKLPPGLASLYQMFFDRLFLDSGVNFAPLGQVLEVIAAAREPLTRDQISAVTGLDAEEELPQILGSAASFVPASEGRYWLFHRSLFDWLTTWNSEEDRPFAGPYYVSLRKGRMRMAEWCWLQYQRGPQSASAYCLRHLPDHLNETGRENDARKALLDFDFIQAKLCATDVNALIADYASFGNEADLKLVQSTIRLSAHVLARDPRQLAGQLTGRLLGNSTPHAQTLLSQAAQWQSWRWLRPLTPSLTQSGGFLIGTLEGHTDLVQAVAVTPDGRHAVSASSDRTLRLWDLESGQTLRALDGHSGSVQAIAVTSDGRRAVSGSDDGTLRLWDLESGQTVRTLQGHTGPVQAVAVTLDGRRAVSASSDRELRIWDLESGETLRTLNGHRGPVNAVAITVDGNRAISGSFDQTLRIWDLEGGLMLGVLEGHTALVNAVALTPEGRLAISASGDKTLRVWDLESGRTLRTLQGHASYVLSVAVTPDGRRAVSASSDRTLCLWELESGQMLHALKGHTNWIQAVVVTPCGRRAVSGSSDCTLRIWDLESSQTLRKLEGHASWVQAVVVTPDGRRAVSASNDRRLRVWDLESAQTQLVLEGHDEGVSAVALTPDGNYAVSASHDRTLRLWDLKTGRSLRTFRGHTSPVQAVAVTFDGSRVISASSDRTLRVWDFESTRTLRTFDGHEEGVSAVALSPDGCRAVSASHDRTLRIWELETGQLLRTLQGHTGSVQAVALMPDGRRAVSASHDRTLRVWDLETGQTLRTFAGHTDVVWNVAIARQGTHAASVGWDRTLRVWDLDGGKEMATFTGDGRIFSCAFALNEKILAGDELGTLHYLRLEG
jgi:WD40 repeat protein/serine/threonine protein kinase